MPIFILITCLLLLSGPLRSEQLSTANAHWPPWRVLESDGTLSGIEIDILTRLSERLGLPLVAKGCGWKRCLKHMEIGSSDVMTGLLKTAEREQYMLFIEPPYRSSNNICFYQERDQLVDINRYEDLHKLTVGVVNKVAYFKQFDNDDSISRISATQEKSLFRLLGAGHVDTVVMACVTGDIFLKQEGLSDHFKHANYVHSIANPVYLAISKKSRLLEKESDVTQALQRMINEGEIQQIMENYGVLPKR